MGERTKAEKPLQARLADILNNSGFPFQMGVRREIERSFAGHGWEVAAEEFPWTHPETGAAGFADLIVQHRQYLFTVVIECKRVRDGQWLFLTSPGMPDRARLSAFWTHRASGDDRNLQGWTDFDFDPVSAESGFCVFQTQDERNPLIERVADGLLPAVEAVGVEEAETMKIAARDFTHRRLYLPVIVTNAALFAAELDAGNVSMASGLLDAGDCAFKAVPCIRFRKGLRTAYSNEGMQAHVSPAANALLWASLNRDRSILVVNSASLAEILNRLRIPENAGYAFGSRMEVIIQRMSRTSAGRPRGQE